MTDRTPGVSDHLKSSLKELGSRLVADSNFEDHRIGLDRREKATQGARENQDLYSEATVPVNTKETYVAVSLQAPLAVRLLHVGRVATVTMSLITL